MAGSVQREADAHRQTRLPILQRLAILPSLRYPQHLSGFIGGWIGDSVERTPGGEVTLGRHGQVLDALERLDVVEQFAAMVAELDGVDTASP